MVFPSAIIKHVHVAISSYLSFWPIVTLCPSTAPCGHPCCWLSCADSRADKPGGTWGESTVIPHTGRSTGIHWDVLLLIEGLNIATLLWLDGKIQSYQLSVLCGRDITSINFTPQNTHNKHPWALLPWREMRCLLWIQNDLDGLLQNCSNSIANTLELPQSFADPLIYI